MTSPGPRQHGTGATSPGAGPKAAPTADFDRIGVGYSQIRRADPRLAAALATALGPAARILNVGAGAGSYEPIGSEVVAAEPCAIMLGQHPGRRRVRAMAEVLPFSEAAFDAAMAVLTVHHWSDLRGGLEEMRRVSRRQVVFTWDPDHDHELWLHSDYLPQMGALERTRFPTVGWVTDLLGAHRVVPFPIPHDFTDGFQHAFWRRPEMFLDPRIRAASSLFAVFAPDRVQPALERLRADLSSGEWERHHGHLRQATAIDYGYRILIAGVDGDGGLDSSPEFPAVSTGGDDSFGSEPCRPLSR